MVLAPLRRSSAGSHALGASFQLLHNASHTTVSRRTRRTEPAGRTAAPVARRARRLALPGRTASAAGSSWRPGPPGAAARARGVGLLLRSRVPRRRARVAGVAAGVDKGAARARPRRRRPAPAVRVLRREVDGRRRRLALLRGRCSRRRRAPRRSEAASAAAVRRRRRLFVRLALLAVVHRPREVVVVRVGDDLRVLHLVRADRPAHGADRAEGPVPDEARPGLALLAAARGDLQLRVTEAVPRVLGAPLRRAGRGLRAATASCARRRRRGARRP